MTFNKSTVYFILLIFIVTHLTGCLTLPQVSPGTYRETLDRVIEGTQERLNSTQIDPIIVKKSEDLTAGSKNQYEDMARVYDWVIHNIDYDIEKYKLKMPYHVDPVKTLQTKKGICQDYAQLTQQLLLASGIESEVKTGKVVTDSGTELHAWNEVWADGVLYALDATWGAGFLSPDLNQFIRRPTRLFLTSPEELQKLHRNPDYLQEQLQELMKIEARKAAPEFLSGHEEKLFSLVNSKRRQSNAGELSHKDDLKNEARRLAEEAADKVSAQLDWSLDLNTSMKKLNAKSHRVSTLSANVYVYWGFQPATAEEIFNELTSQKQNLDYILSKDFNSLGFGVVQRGDLIIACQLLAYYP